METLEDMYARMMADAPERVQCAKVDACGADDTLEALYGQRMAQHESVKAANPYGCNQYGEGWASPHNGLNSAKDKPVKKTDVEEQRKKEQEEAERIAREKQEQERQVAEKKAKEDAASRIERIKAAKSPAEFIDACGLSMTEDATEEQIDGFMQQLKKRHPENKKFAKRICEFTDHPWTRAESAKITKTYENVLSMMNPDIARSLTRCQISVLRANKQWEGEYSNGRINYVQGVNSKAIMHEFIHHVHDSSSDETYNKLSDYFRKRIRTSSPGQLSCGCYGFQDHFRTANDRWNDYAGALYKGRKERRVTGDLIRPRRKYQDDYNGVELATTHLEKLMGSKKQFTAYWNDKKYGKYYWREAFMESMNLFFNK